MTKCVYCGKESEFPIGYKRKFCDNCVKEKEVATPTFHQTINFTKHGLGFQLKSRIDEVLRRKILPIKPKLGENYYVGRKCENGKIAEKEPSY